MLSSYKRGSKLDERHYGGGRQEKREIKWASGAIGFFG